MKMIHKSGFVVGIYSLVLASYLFGRSVDLFNQFCFLVLFFLMLIRTVRYFMKGWQFFMLDFCIFSITLTFIYYWFMPTDHNFFIIIYGFNCGPLLWAILAMRNSFVFHSLDR